MRVGVEPGTVRVRETLGLGLHVNRCGGLEAHRAQVEMLQDIQHLQRRESLGIGAHGIDIHPPIRSQQRFDPFGTLLAQVLAAQPSTDALEIGVDGLGNGTVVKHIPPSRGDRAVGACEIAVAKNVSVPWHVSRRRIGTHRVVAFFEPRAELAK